MYIPAGGFETLLDDSRMLAEAIRRADGLVKLDVFPEMQHVFQFLAGVAPEADDAIGRLAAWVRAEAGAGLGFLAVPVLWQTGRQKPRGKQQ